MTSTKNDVTNKFFENNPKYQLGFREVINGDMSLSEATDSLPCLSRILKDCCNNRDAVLLDALNDVYDLSKFIESC